MKIRRATTADIDALVNFNQAMAQETENKRLDEGVLRKGISGVFADDARGFYVVAEDEKGFVTGGLMVTYEWTDWRNGIFWWIQSVYILPEYRGQKIYSKLYEFVKNEAANDDNVRGFRLYVERENFHAQKVYRQLGMDETHYLMFEAMK